MRVIEIKKYFWIWTRAELFLKAPARTMTVIVRDPETVITSKVDL